MMDARVSIPLKTCIRREPNPQACTPPGFEWIPGYLNQYGGQLTDYARNWFIDKWEEPYRAALESAEREYLDCLQGGGTDTQKPSGLQLRLASKLDARISISESQPAVALSTQVNVHFSPTGGTPLPCDPFDPDPPSYPVDPNAPPVNVPRSIFWKGASATYDLDALEQAMQPVNSLLNPANPLSLRDLQLTADGVMGAVRIIGHSFLPIPVQVQVYDDLQTELEVASIRLDITAEWANSGAVLDSWSAISSSVANPAAYTDFYCYYLGCSWWTSPQPLFNWALVPSGCLDEVILRAQPSPVTNVRVMGESGLLDTITLSINRIGSIASRPLVARHLLFKNPDNPDTLISLPPIVVPPVGIGEAVEVLVAVPDCLVGNVSLAAEQSIGDVQFSGAILPHTEGWVKLTLTRLLSMYEYQAAVEVRFDLLAKVDVLFNDRPDITLVASTLVTWVGCGELSAPHFTLSPIQVGPTPPGGTERIVLSLPDCLIGKMTIAPPSLQSISSAFALVLSTESTNTISLSRRWAGQLANENINLRFIPTSSVGAANTSTPHVIVRVPVEWASCGNVAAPHFTLPGIDFNNPALGETREFVITLPACVVGKMRIAPANLQSIPSTSVTYWNGNIGVVSNSNIGFQVLAGDSPETVKVRLTANMRVAVWDFDLAIRLIAEGVITPTIHTPHILLKIPVSGFANPDWANVSGSIVSSVSWGVRSIPGSINFHSHWTTVTVTAVASHPDFNAWIKFIHLRVGASEGSVTVRDSISVGEIETIRVTVSPSGPHASYSFQKPAHPPAVIEMSPKNTTWNHVKRQANGTYLSLPQPSVPFPFQSYS